MSSRTLKVILLSAAPGAGATNLMNVFLNFPFETTAQKTTAADIQVKQKIPVVFNLDQESERDGFVNLTIVDTSATSQERWTLARTAHVAVVVFDSTSREMLEDGVPEVCNNLRTALGGSLKIPVVLVAAKTDSEDRRIGLAEAQQAGKEVGAAAVLEASSMTDLDSVNGVFDEAIIQGFEAQGTTVAICDIPAAASSDQQQRKPEVGASSNKDEFAPQLVKREIAPLPPPVLVPAFKDPPPPAEKEEKKKDGVDDDEDETGTEAKPDFAAQECASVVKSMDRFVAMMDDAREMLELLRKNNIEFEGKVFSTSK